MTKYIRTHGREVRGLVHAPKFGAGFATVALALAVALGLALAFAGGAGVFASHGGPYGNEPVGTVTLCHDESGDGTDYHSSGVINFNAAIGGHDGHQTDIIPPFHYQQNQNAPIEQYDGKNWDKDFGGGVTGESVWQNDCVIPGQGPTTGTIVIEKQTDPDGSVQSFEFDPDWKANFLLTDGGQNSSELNEGTYEVLELTESGWSANPDVSCTGQNQSVATPFVGGVRIELVAGETVTCVFTNTQNQAPDTSTVTICKYDDLDNLLSGWDVSLSGDSDFNGTTGENGCVEFADVPFDDYILGETLQDGWVNVSGDGEPVVVDDSQDSFTFDLINHELAECEDGIDNDNDGFIDHSSLNDVNPDINCDSPGDDNESGNPKLTVIKEVLGSDLAPSSFTLTITPPNGSPFNQAGEGAPGVDNTFSATGSYSVVENDSQGATVAYSADCSGEIDFNEHKTCTVTNRFPTGGSNDYRLDVTITGDGSGSVEGGETEGTTTISCVTDGEENDCEETYSEGTEVTLVATADEGSNFDSSWTTGAGTCTGNTTPCTVTMNSDISLVAHFALNSSGGGGGGSSGGGGGGTSFRRDTGGGSQPEGEVLGEVLQVTTVPAGAPNTGFGGTAAESGTAAGMTLVGMLSLLIGVFGLSLATKRA